SYCSGLPCDLPSFPTRRSSDLHAGAEILPNVSTHLLVSTHVFLETLHYGVWLVAMPLVSGMVVAPWRFRSIPLVRRRGGWPRRADRKSTRLNSSHVSISYAVFC